MKMNKKRGLIWTIILSIGLLAASCSSPQEKKAITLYKTQCASCHLLPAIQDLPKHIWENGVLPDMAARMGIIDSTNNPYKGLSFDEQYAIKQTGIYPNKPQLSLHDWELLKSYIITIAPDSLVSGIDSSSRDELAQFVPRPIRLDSSAGAFITFLKYDGQDNSVIIADLNGNLLRRKIKMGETETLTKTGEAITSYTEKNGFAYITHTGYLNPSEIARGNIQIKSNHTLAQIPIVFHRPVHTLVQDLDEDGQDELVVSEFGNLTGALSLLSKEKDQEYEKKILLNRPGSIRTLSKDMNDDGKKDLIALTSQGKESIVILYQQNNLEFNAHPVINFSPVYGTSWFELIDYDGDGHDDIITVHGDNADQSYVQKPYHGLRIHINDGQNRFTEKYFYALNGATRVVARDFDQDGDVDFGVLSTFPDYKQTPEFSFVYLENENSENFQFKPYTFQDSKLGRWLLMDAGDVDKDGDDDIVLSSFTYVFTPVPKEVTHLWETSNVDLMVLENKLVP
ncbi:FG-GAP repeat domain-containing protein [Pricia sp.]|uniref:FG-GAP repeat domain-containing protein n=1 Tax=Pricia sp. TaxID=2268138 RepID=UPI0035947293